MTDETSSGVGKPDRDSALAALGRVGLSIREGRGLPPYVGQTLRRLSTVVWLSVKASRLGRGFSSEYWRARRQLNAVVASGARSAIIVFANGRWQVAQSLTLGETTQSGPPIRLADRIILDAGDPYWAADDDLAPCAYRPSPIDAVFTWVDGSDPAWRAAFDRTVGSVESLCGPLAANPSRYRDRGELRAALRALALYAPWLERVFVVAAGQCPDWLDQRRVVVVDHREILDPEDLPTFNSHAIEAALHRIPGLAEHYVYFNDDVILGQGVSPGTFFAGEGLLRLFPDPSAPISDASDAPVDRAARRTQAIVRRLTGAEVEFKLRHSPHPQLRSVVEELERAMPSDFAQTRASRIRSPSDLSVPSSLAPRYAEATGRGVSSSLDVEYVNVGSRWAWLQMRDFELSRSRTVICINETSIAAGEEDRVGVRVERFLRAAYPIPSKYEKSPGSQPG